MKTIPKKKNCKKAKWLSQETLQIAEERREAKSKGERERYTQLNEGFQRITKLQWFVHLMWRADSSEKTLLLGKIEGKRRREWQRRWLDGITDLVDMNLSNSGILLKDREPWNDAVHGVANSWTQLSDWTATASSIKAHTLHSFW